jgi:hypothetical protein
MNKIKIVIKLPSLFLALSVLLTSALFAQQNLSSVFYLENADEVAFKNVVFMLKSTEGIDQVVHRQAKDENSKALIYCTYQHENARISAMQEIYNMGYQPVVAGTNVPADFPQMMNDGTKADRISFAAAKALWIENNPERYAEMNVQSEVIVISQEEFDQMPDSKQEYILENPDLYQIQP